jgi:hypothetical protein
MQLGIPLCCAMIIPDGTRLVCMVPKQLQNKRQMCIFTVHSPADRGGTPLFSIACSELGEHPNISLQSLPSSGSESECLAYASTDELWNISDPHAAFPSLKIFRGSGTLYGTIQKIDTFTYHVSRGQTHLLTLSGNFSKHDVKVSSGSGREVASTYLVSSTPHEYQVQVQSRVDAGLVILSLCAVDKCEIGIQNL